MYKTKIASLFLTVLAITSNAIADQTQDTRDDGVGVQCSAPNVHVPTTLEEANSLTAPVTSVDTSNRVVLGFRNQGENQIKETGQVLGTISSPGHLINVPLWFVDKNGKIGSIDQICFLSNHDPDKNDWKRSGLSFKPVPRAGHVSMSASGVFCHNTCSGTIYNFGVGSYG